MTSKKGIEGKYDKMIARNLLKLYIIALHDLMGIPYSLHKRFVLIDQGKDEHPTNDKSNTTDIKKNFKQYWESTKWTGLVLNKPFFKAT